MHHIFLLLDANATAKCTAFFASLSKRLTESSNVRITLHYQHSFRIAKLLPQRSNLVLEPYKITPTLQRIQQLASRYKESEIVDLLAPEPTPPPTQTPAPLIAAETTATPPVADLRLFRRTHPFLY